MTRENPISQRGLATCFPPIDHPVHRTTWSGNEMTNFINAGKILSVRADKCANFDAMQLLLEHGAGMHSYFEILACLVVPKKSRSCAVATAPQEKSPGPLNHRADIDTQSLSLLSPLHEALRQRYFEVGWVLFAYGERMEISPHSRWLFKGACRSRATAIRAWRAERK